MKEPQDAGKYQVDNDGTVQGQVIGDHNITHQYFAKADNENKATQMAVFHKLESLMPALLAEMRKDLTEYPLAREIIVLSRSWTYNGDGSTLLIYYYEDHSQLKDKMTILCNHLLLVDITYNNVKRHNLTEKLADYLTQG